MLYPLKVVDLELSNPLPSFEGLDGYMGVQALVRLHGAPIGYIQAPITADCIQATMLSELILEKHSKTIIRHLLHNGLASASGVKELKLEELFDIVPPSVSGTLPLVTVAVCTRDRASDLALCIDSLLRLDYPFLDILIVDNAPSNNATELLVKNYPQIRYALEPRPGLDWARNRAIMEAKGEIIAYTDDDVVIDGGWVKALANIFVENPEVMAVTGLVVPYELETEAQVLFEMYGGFGRGFERKWHCIGRGNKVPWGLLGTGQFGTGANMAYRRCVFEEIGYFDPALDVGTVTNGGGDLEMFFRVLKEGHTLVYEPRAIARHRHRRDYEKLRSQLANNSTGLLSYCVRSILNYPDEWLGFLQLWLWWLRHWNLGRIVTSWFRPLRFPRDLVLAELKGCFLGFNRYQKARRIATEIAEKFGSVEDVAVDRPSPPLTKDIAKRSNAVAVRTVDLSQLSPLTDVSEYSKVRVFVKCGHHLFGSIDIANPYESISRERLIEAIVKTLNIRLLDPARKLTETSAWAEAIATLKQHYTPTETTPSFSPLSADISVSIVVATYDRPDDLRQCLHSLVVQKSPRNIEIIVVDNHPNGITPPVVAEFPGVILISESRQGLSYARNAGIVASKGDIILSTDDDVTVPEDWVENLVAPFARPDVMIVTGNVFPIQLETTSQQFFEAYGGLGRGFKRREVNGKWFESFTPGSVLTWTLGACANAAFRASIFSHPEIGLIDETLGAGTPAGCSEDTYVFYKVLKLGYTLIYEPNAYVWHKHRTDIAALHRQLYNYSKGHVAYHLTTWLNDGDWRGLVRIFVGLPLGHVYHIKDRLLRRSDHPIALIGREMAGNLAGFWAFWQSRQRVKREGKSKPYIPVSDRPASLSVNPLLETPEIPTAQPLTYGN